MQIDSLDKRIIGILKDNARIPFLEVARACQISGAAVHQRVQRLTRLGIIRGTQFNLDPKKLGYHTCAFMGIFLERASMFKDVVAELNRIPEVTECHYIMGNYSIFVKVYARDNEHLKYILLEKLQVIKGVVRTETMISLEQTLDRQVPVL